jgi:hypothetical protein
MSKNRNRGARVPKGKFGDNRHAWTRTQAGEAICYVALPDENESNPDLDRVTLTFTKNGRHLSIDLTNLTHQELQALQTVIGMAIEIALPVCEELDDRAQKAKAKGDDTDSRLYRAVSKIHVRERPQREHRTRLSE